MFHIRVLKHNFLYLVAVLMLLILLTYALTVQPKTIS